MYYYQAYNLFIASELFFPELIAEESDGRLRPPPDITIRYGQLGQPADRGSDTFRDIQPVTDGLYVAWQGVGAFWVRCGREIVVDPEPDVPESVVRLFILGAVFALLLHQRRGTGVFHGSSVAVGGRAVTFLGDKGLGKSTLAAVLQQRGHRFMTDDIVALHWPESRPTVVPGFPGLKLWPDSISLLHQNPERLPRLHPEFDKRHYWLTDPCRPASAPLAAICILSAGPEPACRRLPPQEALVALLQHWYAARFGPEILAALGMDDYFRQCARLADVIPVYRLQRAPELGSAFKMATLLEEELGDC